MVVVGGSSSSRPSLLAVVRVLALVLVVIGGTAVQGYAQGAAEPIRIGTLMPLTGAGGPFGATMYEAIVGALEEINAAGGPLGRPIVLIHEDTQTDPEAAVRGALKLVEVNQVSAILGTWASGSTIAVAPVAQRRNVVHMSTSGASRITEIQRDGYVYRTEPDDMLFGKAFAEYALSQGWTRAAVLGLSVPFSESMIAAFRERFEERGGQVLDVVMYHADQTSYRSEVTRAFRGNPDVVFLSSYEPDATSILRDAYRLGIDGNFMITGFAVSSALIRDAGPAAEGLILLDEGVAEDSPAYERVRRLVGEDGYHSFAAQVYDQLVLVALAIEASGGTSGEAIHSALRRVSGPPGKIVTSFDEGVLALRAGEEIDYEGASGPIDFDENGNITRANFRVSQVRDGVVTPIGLIENVQFE